MIRMKLNAVPRFVCNKLLGGKVRISNKKVRGGTGNKKIPIDSARSSHRPGYRCPHELMIGNEPSDSCTRLDFITGEIITFEFTANGKLNLLGNCHLILYKTCEQFGD